MHSPNQIWVDTIYCKDEEKEVEDGVNKEEAVAINKEEAVAINVTKEDGEQNIADNQNDSEKGMDFCLLSIINEKYSILIFYYHLRTKYKTVRICCLLIFNYY